MLVQGAQPLEIIRQYMAKGDSPTRGRELNIHFGDTVRGFVGQISHLGDMVPVMAGVTLSFKLRAESRVGMVYVGDGATSTGAFHEGINFAAVQRCPLVVIVENNGYAYSTPNTKQSAVKEFKDKALAYGIPGVRADGNDVLATYDVTRDAVDRARRGEGVSLIELMTYRRKGHAEHDNQSYVPSGEIERWEKENDPIDRVRARAARGAADREEGARRDRRAGDRGDRSGHRSRRAVAGGRADGRAVRRVRGSGRGGPALVSARASAPRSRKTNARRDGGRSMAEITYLEAIREALFEEMERDSNVFCMGEDIGAYGGAFKVTDGLMAKYGEQRVIDTPISEAGFVGAAAGASHMGMRPVVEMQFIDFISCAYDMLTNYIATARYRAFLPCPLRGARTDPAATCAAARSTPRIRKPRFCTRRDSRSSIRQRHRTRRG